MPPVTTNNHLRHIHFYVLLAYFTYLSLLPEVDNKTGAVLAEDQWSYFTFGQQEM